MQIPADFGIGPVRPISKATDLRKLLPDDPRTSRSKSGPNWTRRNPAVTTRAPEIDPYSSQRTSENPEHPVCRGPCYLGQGPCHPFQNPPCQPHATSNATAASQRTSHPRHEPDSKSPKRDALLHTTAVIATEFHRSSTNQ